MKTVKNTHSNMLQPELGVGKTNSSNEFLKMCKQLEFSF